jgi:hypothetical protein
MILRQAFFALALVAAIPHSVPALASTMRLIRVAQPMMGEGTIEIFDVPVVDESFNPAAEVAMTCNPNAIHVTGEESRAHEENRNAATFLGLTVVVSPSRDGQDLFDTLTVTLDASRADSLAGAGHPDGSGWSTDSIVAATVMCLRINASRSPELYVGDPPRPRVRSRYLRLRIVGPAHLRRLAGVYKLAPFSESSVHSYSAFGPPPKR